LLLPGLRMGREPGHVDEHVKRFVAVGSGCLFDGTLVEVVDLENPSAYLLQLEDACEY
jgi:hypothetical protein